MYQFIIESLKVDMLILLLSMQSEISKIPSVHQFGITCYFDIIACLLIYIFVRLVGGCSGYSEENFTSCSIQ